MTRLRHIFRHLSSAAKKTTYSSDEWKALNYANSAEKAAAKAEIAGKIQRVEKKLAHLKKNSEERNRLLDLEERLIGIKRKLQ